MVILYYSLSIYEIVLLVRVLLSWIRSDPHHPVVHFIYSITEPVLKPVRRLLPFGRIGIDLSPIIVFILLDFLKRILISGRYGGF